MMFLCLLIYLLPEVLANNCSNYGDLRFNPLNSRILQICTKDKWTDICAKPGSNQWSENEARVACYQMGMTWKEGSELNFISPFSYRQYLVLFENFSCTGIEEKLIECSTIPAGDNYDCIYDYHNGMQKYHYATIDCSIPSTCKFGSLSLEGNVLKICVFGQWHTLCGDTWTLAQAKVTCRQLGRNPIGARNTSVSSNNSTPILNAYFKCNGTERNLKYCLVRQWSDCYMNLSVAGLTCGENLSINLVVRLLDTSSVNILLDTNMTHDTGDFNVYCNTLKQQQQHQQVSYCYSKTISSNGNNTVNTSITGLLPNTTYTCCVLAVTSHGESKPVCQNVTIATANSTAIVTATTVIINQTPLCMTKNSTFASAIIPWVGGIVVGVVSGILVMVIVWVIVTIIGKKKTKADMKKRSHDSPVNIGVLDNPTYEQTIIQSTQSNSNYQGTDLPEDQYLIPVNIRSKTMTSNSQVNDTIGDVHSFIYQDDIQMEVVYSLPDGQQTGEGLYNQLQRN